MKKKTSKLYKAIDRLADLYALDTDALLKGAVQQHTLYQTLERVGYTWNGVQWSLRERPWMLPYRAQPAAESSPLSPQSPPRPPEETD